jgi:sugar phosphate isomerase/epimerase
MKTRETSGSLKISIETAALHMPLRKALDAALELGVEGIVIDARNELSPRELSRTGVREVRKMLEDRRLRVVAVAFRTRRGYATAEDLDRRVAATKAAMEMASQFGARMVLNAIGRVPAEDDADGRRMLVEVLDDLGRFGSRVGAILAAETGSESGEQLARLLALFPEGALGIDFNPGKLLAAGFSPEEAISSLGPRILHVHVQDARRGPAPGRTQPVSLGRGDADFPALLAALDEHAYCGYFTVEPAVGDDPMRAMAETIERFRGLA